MPYSAIPQICVSSPLGSQLEFCNFYGGSKIPKHFVSCSHERQLLMKEQAVDKQCATGKGTIGDWGEVLLWTKSSLICGGSAQSRLAQTLTDLQERERSLLVALFIEEKIFWVVLLKSQFCVLGFVTCLHHCSSLSGICIHFGNLGWNFAFLFQRGSKVLFPLHSFGNLHSKSESFACFFFKARLHKLCIVLGVTLRGRPLQLWLMVQWFVLYLLISVPKLLLPKNSFCYGGITEWTITST